MSPQTETTTRRPRVEGVREAEILDATLEVLAEVGYDRLTMDAVAAAGQGLQGHALPPLERQGQPRHRRAAPRPPAERPAAAPRHRARCAATCIAAFCGIGGLTDKPEVGTLRRHPHRDHPRRRVRRGVPTRGHRPQAGRLQGALRARQGARRDPRRRRPRPARAGPGRDRAAPRLPLGESPHRGPRHPRHRPDHPSGRDRGRLTDVPPTQREITHDRHPTRGRRRGARRRAGASKHLGWALVLISVAQLMVVLDGTIVNIALPYIQSDLDISSANLTLGRHRLRAGLRQPAAARRPAR